jgi:L-histidine N-alpha-methyltransferase
MGSGSSTKTRVLLDALLARQGPSTYVPIDVSGAFLNAVAKTLQADFTGLTVEPVAAEYKSGLAKVGKHPAKRRLVLFLGSSLGNFEPDEQVSLLKAAYDCLDPGDAFLLGTDMVKDAQTLRAAYNDAEGVTAAFNKNILTRIARDLGGAISLDSFDHEAIWNAQRSRIEMHLRSRRNQRIHLPKANLEVNLAEGETIHTENSYKFTVERIRQMVSEAGWQLEQTWQDDQKWFGLHLLRRE